MTTRNRQGTGFIELLHFDRSDLELNRQGILSRKQKRRLTGSAKALLITILVVLALLTAGIYAVNDNPLTTAQYAAIGIIWALLSGIGLFYYFRIRMGVTKNTVKQATGKISFKRIMSKYISQDYLMVEGYDLTLACPWGGEEAVSPQKQYNVYYLDSTGEVLSIEPAHGTT